MGVTATAPDGATWRVRRLWLPRFRRRLNDIDEGGWTSLDVSMADDLAGAALGILVVLGTILVIVFLPYIFLVFELVLLPLLLLAKIVFHRPWTIEAAGGGRVIRWTVRGWRASGEAVKEAASAIERGEAVSTRTAEPLVN